MPCVAVRRGRPQPSLRHPVPTADARPGQILDLAASAVVWATLITGWTPWTLWALPGALAAGVGSWPGLTSYLRRGSRGQRLTFT